MVKLGARFLGRPLSSGTKVFNLTQPEVFSNIGSGNAITKGFDSNISVYSVVSKDAKKFGSIPVYLYDATKKEEKAVVNRVLFECKALTVIKSPSKSSAALTILINRPNKQESQDAFLTRVRAYYKVCGESFIWLNRGDIEDYRLPDGSFDDMAIDRLPVLEMQVLPANLITIIPDPLDAWGVLGYILEVGERLVIRKNDIIHWKNTNLNFDASSRDHMRGMTPMRPGSKTLSESDALSFYSMRSAQNDGSKAIIFEKSMKSITPTQMTQIKSVVDAKVNNLELAGQVATLQGDWGVIDLSMSSKDMETIEKKKMSWQEIAFLFDVPNEFFDTQTTFANKEQALLAWVTNEIIPACKQLNGEFNRVLLKAFSLEGIAVIASDWSDLPEIQKGMVEAAKMMQDIWCVSPDDVREMLGYEPLGGQFSEPWVPSGRVPLSMANQDDGMSGTALAMEKNRVANGY